MAASIRKLAVLLVLLAMPQLASSEATVEDGDKRLSGMSIVGDHESPKSLVIVPWKSSDPGARIGVSRILDDGRRPVDREVFMRELDFYRIGAEAFSVSGSGAR